MQKRIPLLLAALVLAFSIFTAPGVRAMPVDPIDEPVFEPSHPIDEGGDLGGGGGIGGGGGTITPPVDPFNPPPRPYFYAPDLTLYGQMSSTGYQHCNQIAVAYVAFSNDAYQGTPLYPAGVVNAGSRINFGFYDTAGNLVKLHLTQPAHSNCVVNHEPEIIYNWDLAPGYYYVYASYWGLSTTGGLYDGFDGWPSGHVGVFITALRIR
jgi:hypothetical protein